MISLVISNLKKMLGNLKTVKENGVDWTPLVCSSWIYAIMPNHAILHRNYRPVFSFSPFVPSLGVPCVSAIAGSPTTRSQSSRCSLVLSVSKRGCTCPSFPQVILTTLVLHLAWHFLRNTPVILKRCSLFPPRFYRQHWPHWSIVWWWRVYSN